MRTTFGSDAWREAIRGVALFPSQLVKLLVAASRLSLSKAMRYLCGTGLGLIGWFAALITLQALVNGVLYPLVDAHDYQHSWGGPTLAGAWAAHFLISLVFLPLLLWILRGLVQLGTQIDPANNRQKKRWWAMPLSALLTLGAIMLVTGWVHQL